MENECCDLWGSEITSQVHYCWHLWNMAVKFTQSLEFPAWFYNVYNILVLINASPKLPACPIIVVIDNI